MISLLVKLRFVLGVALLSLTLFTFYIYGRDNFGLLILCIPALTMMRRMWNDTQHTMFTIGYGFAFLVALGWYFATDLIVSTLGQWFNFEMLMSEEFSLLSIFGFGIPMVIHMIFATIERQDEPWAYFKK